MKILSKILLLIVLFSPCVLSAKEDAQKTGPCKNMYGTGEYNDNGVCQIKKCKTKDYVPKGDKCELKITSDNREKKEANEKYTEEFNRITTAFNDKIKELKQSQACEEP